LGLRKQVIVDRADGFWERLGGFGYGGDYNPEQWSPATWVEDMALMRQAGVNVVNLGVFAWAELEPEPGRYRFEWLDDVVNRLHRAGVAVDLATATASPPPWLVRMHPEILPVTRDGVRLSPGSRQHFCPSSLVYREYAGRLVEQLATRYGAHPALAAWHVGNEYGCHVAACYCDQSAAAFRGWLQDSYGRLDLLNGAWSTTFWSQHYAEWEEVLPPRRTPAPINPAQQLDFARFSSDALLGCFKAERAVLARLTPDVPVTTNLLSVAKSVDYFAWAEHLDIISHDSYPDPLDDDTVTDAAFGYDLMRSLRSGRPWILMEQAPSAVNWRPRNAPKPPGVMRLWSYQAIAHGADAIMFFQWRASLGGAEKFHSAMVPHGGTSTRIWREVAALGQELQALTELAGTRVAAEVAIVMDWPSWWAVEQDSHPSEGIVLVERLREHYGPLWQANIATDVAHPESDLSKYRFVVVPNLYLMSKAAVDNLQEYVHSGGHLLVSFFSGIVDECDRIQPDGYAARLLELLGVRIVEFWPQADGAAMTAEFGRDGAQFAATLWADVIESAGAEVLATYVSDDLVGLPAITRHRYGSGTVTYLGTRPDPAAMRRVILGAATDAGAGPVIDRLPAGVEVTRRSGPATNYLIVLNHNASAVSLDLASPVTNLLDPQAPAATSRLVVPARGVAVVRE
jgi:beta-galactosidase